MTAGNREMGRATFSARYRSAAIKGNPALPSPARGHMKSLLTVYIVPVVPRSGIRHARLENVPVENRMEAAGASGHFRPLATMQAAVGHIGRCPGLRMGRSERPDQALCFGRARIMRGNPVRITACIRTVSEEEPAAAH